MNIPLTIFNQTYKTITWSRCQIKIGRLTIERCTLAGLGKMRESTDYGQVDSITGDLRLRDSDEPTDGVEIGIKIQIKQYGKDNWQNARVLGRYTQGGVTRLTVEAVNE